MSDRVPFSSWMQTKPSIPARTPVAYTRAGTPVYMPLTPSSERPDRGSGGGAGGNGDRGNVSAPAVVPPGHVLDPKDLIPRKRRRSMPLTRSSECPDRGSGGGAGGNGDRGNVSALAVVPPGHVLDPKDLIPRKRGRPRKYGPDGNLANERGSASRDGNAAVAIVPGGSAPSAVRVVALASAAPSAQAKKRGRPPGSEKKQQKDALGPAGIKFTPHVITVEAGEDISSKILSVFENGLRTVCVLSANGAVSKVTLRQAATSGGTVTYEGRFEILLLSGSLLSESAGQRNRNSGLRVSLAGPDCHVFGGEVVGLLTAASSIQVIVGSFIARGMKDPKQTSPPNLMSTPENHLPTGPGGPSSPSSGGTQSESSSDSGSSLSLSTETFNNSNQKGPSKMPWK